MALIACAQPSWILRLRGAERKTMMLWPSITWPLMAARYSAVNVVVTTRTFNSLNRQGPGFLVLPFACVPDGTGGVSFGAQASVDVIV